jgi:hypothetical protein
MKAQLQHEGAAPRHLLRDMDAPTPRIGLDPNTGDSAKLEFDSSMDRDFNSCFWYIWVAIGLFDYGRLS